MSPKLYCPHCYRRTGNKYPSHGYPGKPPCKHIHSAALSDSVASPAHVSPPAPASHAKPYAQSYFSQQHYPSNHSYGSSQSPAAFVAQQHSLQLPTSSYEGLCRAFVSNMQNGAPEKSTSSILDDMYNLCDDHQPST